jgi:hypothetical protein
MATPPSSPPPGAGYYGGGGMPPVPVPNPEVIVYVVALLVAGIVALAAETLAARDWLEFAKWVTVAYLLARGLAKLGNAHENR